MWESCWMELSAGTIFFSYFPHIAMSLPLSSAASPILISESCQRNKTRSLRHCTYFPQTQNVKLHVWSFSAALESSDVYALQRMTLSFSFRASPLFRLYIRPFRYSLVLYNLLSKIVVHSWAQFRARSYSLNVAPLSTLWEVGYAFFNRRRKSAFDYHHQLLGTLLLFNKPLLWF